MSQNDPLNPKDSQQIEGADVQEVDGAAVPIADGQSLEDTPLAARETVKSRSTERDIQGMENSGETHHMSIALTIGATIGVIGLILVLYGLWGNADYSRSDGINVNIWWGLVMLIFGIIMSIGGYFAAHRHV